MRALRRRIARFFTERRDLLGPALKAEFTFHFRHDGACLLYSSKLELTDRQEIGELVKGIINATLNFAQQHGVTIRGEISNARQPEPPGA